LMIVILVGATVRSFEKEWWLLAFTASALFCFMVLCLLIAPYIAGESVSSISGVFLVLGLCWQMVMLYSPLQQLTRRLAFVVLGVLTLVVLSEISKLDLHQYLKPAKVSEISAPTHNLPSHAAA